VAYVIGIKKRLKCTRGAAMVEFAIVLPLLLMLLFGIIEMGVLLYNQAMITNASREGARAGIVYSSPNRITTGEILTVVQNYSSGHMITFGAPVNTSTVIPSGGCVNAGDSLTVTVTYPYSFLVLPNFVTSLAGTLTLTAQTIMRCE
jgi:Flp pilus assembly protein TadG